MSRKFSQWGSLGRLVTIWGLSNPAMITAPGYSARVLQAQARIIGGGYTICGLSWGFFDIPVANRNSNCSIHRNPTRVVGNHTQLTPTDSGYRFRLASGDFRPEHGRRSGLVSPGNPSCSRPGIALTRPRIEDIGSRRRDVRGGSPPERNAPLTGMRPPCTSVRSGSHAGGRNASRGSGNSTSSDRLRAPIPRAPPGAAEMVAGQTTAP